MIDVRGGHFLLLETSPIRVPAIKRAVPNVLPRALVDLACQPEPVSPRSELSTADFFITPAECALARTAKVTPLEYALAEKPGGGGIVLTSQILAATSRHHVGIPFFHYTGLGGNPLPYISPAQACHRARGFLGFGLSRMDRA